MHLDMRQCQWRKWKKNCTEKDSVIERKNESIRNERICENNWKIMENVWRRINVHMLNAYTHSKKMKKKPKPKKEITT